MDSELRRLIDETAEELGITKSQAQRIWIDSGKVINNMMVEGTFKDIHTKKTIFLRNIGTYKVKPKVKYKMIQQQSK